jgi:hypothetical protein
MTYRSSVLASVLCLCLVGCAARASECPAPEAMGGLGIRNDTTFEEDLRALLEVTNALALAKQVGTAVSAAMAAQHPQVPTKFWEELNDELTGERFVGLMIPLYQKHLTHEEVRALVDFYRTPTGSSVIAKMPALTQESMALGAALGQELASEFQSRARATGYKL